MGGGGHGPCQPPWLRHWPRPFITAGSELIHHRRFQIFPIEAVSDWVLTRTDGGVGSLET
jgi:hypothetical protein